MPTYDYRCDACKHQWEEFHSMSAEPTKKCPSCKKLKAKRMIGPGAGVIFKGSGFYLTDYRSDSYKKGADADKKATDTSTKSSDTATKSDSKSSDSSSSSKSESSTPSKKSGES